MARLHLRNIGEARPNGMLIRHMVNREVFTLGQLTYLKIISPNNGPLCAVTLSNGVVQYFARDTIGYPAQGAKLTVTRS